jgi:hypothetical protein
MAGSVTIAPGVDFGFGNEPRVLGALRQLASLLGVHLHVTSAHRTLAQQAALYANRARNPFPVAPPTPADPHVRGIAADVLANGQPIQKVVSAKDLASVGLVGLPGDAVHVQIRDAGGGINLGKIGKTATKVGGTAIGVGQVVGGPVTLGVGIVGDTILGGTVGGPLGDAADAAKDAALAPVKLAVDEAAKEFGAAGARILLYTVLILGGAALALYGLARAVGIDDDLAHVGKTVAKGVATAAVMPK